ncbi:MAG TPA: hypothetical protein VGG64_17820 [Pirellulales bacterium]|jgi:DNA-directed RNA polymerase specialized sigma24 family protein
MTTTTTISLAQLRREFDEHYRLVLAIIHRRLRQLGRYDDELVGEALGQAWEQYPTCRQRLADVGHAIACVAHSGVARALRGTRFVRRERGYVDAMDVRGRAALDRLAARGEKPCRRADRRFVDPADIAARPENTPVDSMDRAAVEAMIARLPQQLQATARLLSYGCPKKLIAERCGVSPATVSRHVGLIEPLLRDMLDERKCVVV